MSNRLIFVRYLLTSAIIASIDYMAFIISFSFDHDVLTSVFIARTVSVLVNFSLLQKKVFFFHGRFSPALIKYILLVFTSGLITTLLIQLFTKHLLFDVIVAKAVAELILYLFNFFVVKKYIFIEKNVPGTLS
jgi:hypothetical protein